MTNEQIEADWRRASRALLAAGMLSEERAAEVIRESGRFVERIGEYLKSQGFEISDGE